MCYLFNTIKNINNIYSIYILTNIITLFTKLFRYKILFVLTFIIGGISTA